MVAFLPFQAQATAAGAASVALASQSPEPALEKKSAESIDAPTPVEAPKPVEPVQTTSADAISNFEADLAAELEASLAIPDLGEDLALEDDLDLDLDFELDLENDPDLMATPVESAGDSVPEEAVVSKPAPPAAPPPPEPKLEPVPEPTSTSEDLEALLSELVDGDDADQPKTADIAKSPEHENDTKETGDKDLLSSLFGRGK